MTLKLARNFCTSPFTKAHMAFHKTQNLQNSTVELFFFFSNGFIKLVQKTDVTHSKCHLFLCGGLPHKPTHATFFWWAQEEKKQNYPSKPLLTHLLVTNRWRENRMEQNWRETKLNLNAVIKRRLLIQNLINDFKVKKIKITITNKKRCYNKIVNTSIALEIVSKIHRKIVSFLFTHCVDDQRTCNQST